MQTTSPAGAGAVLTRNQPPEAAIPPEEDAVSIDAALAMGATFARDDRAEDSAVLVLFDALVELLTGGEHKH